MSGPLNLVIFDVDGTLVDSQHHIAAAMGRAFATAGLSAPDHDRVRSIIGLSLPQAVARLLPDEALDRVDAVVAAYKDAFVGLGGRAEASPLFPGVRDFLDALARRDDVLLGVATGKSRRGLDVVLARHGLAGRFVTEQVADHHPSKPHPSMINAALAETGCAASQTIMIGDTTFDIEMGRNAQVRTVGVGWGYHRTDALREAGADSIVDRMADLDALLAAYLERSHV